MEFSKFSTRDPNGRGRISQDQTSARLVAVLIFWVAFFVAITPTVSRAQTSAFTFQGKLTESGLAANNSYQMRFLLYDQASGGNQIGGTIVLPTVNVLSGIFTVSLDFGPTAFSGGPRFLQVDIFSSALNSFLTMNPRQPIQSAPYAVSSLTALSALDSANLGGIPAAHYIQSTDPRLEDAREPIAGSSSYIQNTTTQQALSNFNVSGTGKANTFEAKTQFNINGSRVLSLGAAGTNNVFVGVFAGENAGSGTSNAAVGYNAGRFLTTGADNALFGTGAGFSLSTQLNNSFFGSISGINTIGASNAFFGAHTGETNSGGNNNTLLGAGTDVLSPNLMNATAIGAGATVSTNNSIVLGRSAGQDSVIVPGSLTVNGTINGNLPAGSSNYIQNTTTQQPSTNFNIQGNGTASGTLSATTISGNSGSFSAGVSAQSFSATTQFSLNGQRVLSAPGTSNLFVGQGSGTANTFGTSNTFIGSNAGASNTSGNNNTYVGAGAGQANSIQSGNSFFGTNAGNKNIGTVNSFFGSNAGAATTQGAANTFFGADAGKLNTTGSGNSYFGTNAGAASQTTTGNSIFGNGAGAAMTGGTINSFFGSLSASNFTTGSSNVVIGSSAATTLTNGSNNTIIGSGADVGLATISNATAIGYNAVAGATNSIVIGDLSSSTHIGIGTSLPAAKLEVTNGDVYVNSTQSGIIMRSPNGSCWRIRPDNSGALISTATVCPL
jgi:hypothetical protein